jgi:DNA-binding NtrC family response regulator
MPARVLIIDDDPEFCELLRLDLSQRGFEIETCMDSAAGLAALSERPFDVALTDLNMPGMDGIDLCHRINANRPDVPVVVLTAFGSMEAAVAAIRAGAFDFVTKPIDVEVLQVVLDRAVRHRELQQQVRFLSDAVERMERFGDLIGASPPMQRLFDQLARVADTEASILITGENGTGKELVARALHKRSNRKDGPFVAINCAAVPENLLESELFGHARGAFTDAKAQRKGLFAQADGGTFLLDEIGDLPLALQPKLLRALEERSVRPVGGDESVPFDVRIIASTNRDLHAAIGESRFREDLFFRINVIQLDVPPLRSRGTDILLLAQHFLQYFAARSNREVTGLSEPVAEKLMSYDWPGNVRELRNAIERAIALTRQERITVEDLPERIRDYRSSELVLGGEDPDELPNLEQVESRYIQHVLRVTSGNKTLAARVLGLDRKTLYRKLDRYGLTERSS